MKHRFQPPWFSWVLLAGVRTGFAVMACFLLVPGFSCANANEPPGFPRIAMLWSAAPVEGGKLDKWARYGVIVTSPGDLGFVWEAPCWANADLRPGKESFY